MIGEPRTDRDIPLEERAQIRRENAAMAVGTVAFWALMGAVFGRMLRVW